MDKHILTMIGDGKPIMSLFGTERVITISHKLIKLIVFVVGEKNRLERWFLISSVVYFSIFDGSSI